MRDLLRCPLFQARHKRDPKDFTRQRCLGFLRVATLVARGMLGSIQRELDEVFAVLFGRQVASREVTDGGFCRARQKMRHTAFVELSREAVGMAYRTMGCIRRIAGYRVLAIDGSKVNLPGSAAVRAHFDPDGKRPGEGGAPQMLLSQCYDVVNGMILDATASPGASCERRAAMAHLRLLGEDDLLLLDRGYPAHWFLRAVDDTGARFVARASVTFSNSVAAFVASGQDAAIIVLEPTDESREACRQFGLDPSPMRVRAVRFPLPGGEVEVLLTNFLTEDFPPDLFGALYHMRWGVEEGFRCLKLPLELENLSGRTVEAVLQDVHAKVFLANMTVITALPAREAAAEATAGRELDYDINWTTAFSKVRAAGVLLFLGHDVKRLVRELQKAVAECLSPIRPGRSNPRNMKAPKKRFASNRKRI